MHQLYVLSQTEARIKALYLVEITKKHSWGAEVKLLKGSCRGFYTHARYEQLTPIEDFSAYPLERSAPSPERSAPSSSEIFLYHFTDKRNLESISKFGLLSAYNMGNMGISAHMSSSKSSRAIAKNRHQHK